MRVHALLIAVVATVTCLVVGLVAVPPVAQARECERPHGPFVAYGHSYLLSPQLGGATASYATLVATALGVKPMIRAVNGGTTLDVERLVRGGATRWVPGSSDLVLVDSAINDIKEQLPTAEWTTALRGLLVTLSARPAPVILLVRPLPVTAPGHPGRDPHVITAYAAAQREVARAFPTVRIVDASSGWNPRLDLSADGVHPTPTGELALAKAVWSTAERAFCAPE